MEVNQFIRLSKSSIGDEEVAMVTRALRDEYLGMGEFTKEFEKQLTEYFGRDAVCVSTGSAALHLACQAIGLKAGDEVLVQSLTFVASFHAITACGATPVPCEIDPESMTIDLTDAKSKLNSRTRAIMPIHYAGATGDLEKIYAFANQNGLRVIEDAAHALGTVYQGKRIGSSGDIVCFSFDGIKNITSGEGGCIVTSDGKVLKRVRDLRLLAIENDSEKRYQGKRSWVFDVKEQGWRYHMSNVMAAIGIGQFKRLESFSKARKDLAKRYVNNLSGHPGIKLLKMDYNEVTPHIFVVRILGKDVTELQAQLESCKIQTGKHYYPNHRHTYFKQFCSSNLPITDQIYPELLTLPLHVDLTLDQVDYVCTTLIKLLRN